MEKYDSTEVDQIRHTGLKEDCRRKKIRDHIMVILEKK